MSAKVNQANKSGKDLVLILKNVSPVVNFDDECVLDEAERKDVIRIIDSASNEISLDRTFVDDGSNPHSDAFMLPEGWNEFKRYFNATKGHVDMDRNSIENITEIMSAVAACYLLEITRLYYPDFQGQIEVDPDSKFSVHVREDTTGEDLFKKYGRWQDWDFN